MKHLKWAVLVAALALVGYAAWIAASNPEQLADAWSRVGWLGFTALCGISFINYLLRYCRWRIFMRAQQQHCSVIDGFICYLSGFALITTPGKIGESVRAVFFKERYGTPVSSTFSNLLGERVTDLLAGVMISAVGFIYFDNLWWVCFVALSVCAAIVASIFFSGFIERLSSWVKAIIPMKLLPLVAPLIDGLPAFFMRARQMLQAKVFMAAMGLGLIAWLIEGLGFAWLAHRLGVDADIALLCSIFTLSLIAGVITPGGLGSAEAAMAFFLLALGATPASALVIALVCRFATLWFAIALGIISLLLLMRRRSIDDMLLEVGNG